VKGEYLDCISVFLQGFGGAFLRLVSTRRGITKTLREEKSASIEN